MALKRHLIGLQIPLELSLVPRHPQPAVRPLLLIGLQANKKWTPRISIIQMLRLRTGPVSLIPKYTGTDTRHSSNLTQTVSQYSIDVPLRLRQDLLGERITPKGIIVTHVTIARQRLGKHSLGVTLSKIGRPVLDNGQINTHSRTREEKCFPWGPWRGIIR
jgi:hypothetical protein